MKIRATAKFLDGNCPFFTMRRKRDATHSPNQAPLKSGASNSIFVKCLHYLDHDYQTTSWVHCNSKTENGEKTIIKLKFNFISKWIVEADCVRLSNVLDHAQNNQHTHAMSRSEPKDMLGSWDKMLSSGSDSDG